MYLLNRQNLNRESSTARNIEEWEKQKRREWEREAIDELGREERERVRIIKSQWGRKKGIDRPSGNAYVGERQQAKEKRS